MINFLNKLLKGKYTEDIERERHALSLTVKFECDEVKSIERLDVGLATEATVIGLGTPPIEWYLYISRQQHNALCQAYLPK